MYKKTHYFKDVRFFLPSWSIDSVSVKNTYRFLLVKIDKLVFKFRRKNKRPKIAKLLLKKMKKVGELAVLDIKIYCKDRVIYTMW